MSDLPVPSGDSPDPGVDLAGIGKAMQAIPAPAWQQLVDTACRTFEKTLSPITETAYGIGRLIQAKFDRMIDVEQVLAAESVDAARRKAEQAAKPAKTPRPQILLQVIENTSTEVDAGVRELWSNLLAQEMLTQDIHPEIGRVLARISFDDAQLLVAITESKPTSTSKLFAEAVNIALLAIPVVGGAIPRHRTDPTTFNHAHLRNLGLIDRYDGKWELTAFGEGFIEAVTDPSLQPENDA
tara:strand:+ start:72 stop:791 length:720 start_codon:yes stop_codon:yes gene_type:complete